VQAIPPSVRCSEVFQASAETGPPPLRYLRNFQRADERAETRSAAGVPTCSAARFTPKTRGAPDNANGMRQQDPRTQRRAVLNVTAVGDEQELTRNDAQEPRALGGAPEELERHVGRMDDELQGGGLPPCPKRPAVANDAADDGAHPSQVTAAVGADPAPTHIGD
jgi:hypothetical protein